MTARRPAPRRPPLLRIRHEADVLALVPFTLGFHPEDSLVLVTLSEGGQPFHARIDLPDEPGDLASVVQVLAQAAVRNSDPRGVMTALVVVYTNDDCVAEAAADLLTAALEPAGFAVVMTIRADGSHWFPLGPGPRDLQSREGTAYDVRDHELTARSVVDGQITYRSREDLVDSLAPADPDLVEEVAAAYAALPALDPHDRDVLVEEGRWLMAQLHAVVQRSAVLGPLATARLLRAVAERDVRDLAWCDITRRDAERHVALWRTVVRCSPEELAGPPASLLAFAAWLAGHGALAWCAIDRSLRADPDNVLAGLVAQALEGAIPPSSWVPVDRRSLPLHAG